MAKGGFRANAGRKPGTPNKDTAMLKALAANVITAQEQGIPEHIAKMGPLEVMSNVMVTALHEGQKQLALSAASQLAPYLAPKLQHITNVTTSEPNKMSDNELQALLAQLKAKAQKIEPAPKPEPQPEPEPEPEPVLFRAAA